MIAISQLLQVLQGAEASTVPQGDAGGEQAPGGLSKLFGAMLEQARGALGGRGALPQADPGPSASLIAEVSDAGDTVDPEVAVSPTDGLPMEETASIFGLLGKLDGLQLGDGTVATDGPGKSLSSAAGAPKNFATQTSVAVPLAGGQAVAPQLDEAASIRGAPKVTAEALPVEAVLVESGEAVPRRAAAGMAPAQGLMKALADRMASPKGQVGPAVAQQASAVLSGEGEGVPRVPREVSSLQEMFARAVTKQHLQDAPKPAKADGAMVTGTQDPLLVASKAQVLDSVKALMPPSGAEAGKVAQPPPADTAVVQAAPERAPAEVVQVRDAGQFIVKTVRYLAGRHDEVVIVRLVPRSLGEMQIAVSNRGDGLEIVIRVASQVARETLEAQISGLREALSRDGSEVAKVTVQTYTPGDQGPGQSGPGNSATPGHAARHATKFTRESDEPETGPRASPERASTHEGSLNMFV